MAGQAAGGANVDLTPNMARIKNAGAGAVWGGAGALAMVMGGAILGPGVGPVLGGVLAGAVIGGPAGQVIAINAAMDTTFRAIAGA